MPDLSEIQTLVDFGMCVVLWLVQLVIYPSFLRIEASQLLAWHKSYSFRVSFVIMPLILTQLALAMWAVTTGASIYEWIAFVLVIICWALTFLVSVPLHRKIDQGDLSMETRRKLIQTNWPRTILWTAIFVIGLLP